MAVKRLRPEYPCYSKIVDPATEDIYFVGPCIGSGGFGECYEMWKRGDQKNIVAGKIIPKQKLAEKESLRKRVMQEIVVFKYLDHPNVVRMMGDFTTPQSIVILMELCTQQTLHELQRRRGKLTEEETRFFTRHIVEGLKYLRDLQIVHRDIKPANLFLDAHLTVKIGDFGLAIYDSDRRGGVCGTPNYMAPEILEKKPYSFGVDLWALGCTIYGMLCGRPPFDGGVLDKTAKKIRSGEFKLPASMSAPAKNLISDMLKLNPEDRLRIHEVQHTEFFNTGAVKPPRQEIQDASGTRYEVGDYLYDCSFGNIYAMSIDGGPMSLVAKVVNKATLDQDTYERVLQEICVMKRLEHPNVAQFVDSIPEETSMYLLYEPCISYPLSRLMKRRRTLREEEVRYYMGQVVDGLEYLHNEANIVHGNLCTDALCLTENMTVKLCDFGLAAVIEGAKAGESYGEPKYQAPERYEQAGYSYDVDMYALGCTVYELLTGNELDLEFAALSTVSMYAASAIKKLTDSDPKTRMKLKDLPRSRFFRMVHCPDSMPTSSLSSVPEFDATRPPRPLLTHSQTAE